MPGSVTLPAAEWDRLPCAPVKSSSHCAVSEGLPRPSSAAHRTARRREGRAVALLGFDQAGAEVLVDLITAASLPDSGEVNIFGKPTRSITDPESLAAAARPVRHPERARRAARAAHRRAEPGRSLSRSKSTSSPAELHTEVVRLADEVGLDTRRAAAAGRGSRSAAQRAVRLGRALALKPRVLLASIPTPVCRA